MTVKVFSAQGNGGSEERPVPPMTEDDVFKAKSRNCEGFEKSQQKMKLQLHSENNISKQFLMFLRISAWQQPIKTQKKHPTVRLLFIAQGYGF